MRFLNKLSENILRKIIIVISVYTFLILLIPIYKAIFSERLSVDDNYKTESYDKGVFNGLVITRLPVDGVSYKAGLREGDIIIRLNGMSFEDRYDFQKLLNQMNSGEPAQYTILRNEFKLIKYVEVYKYLHLIFFVFASLSLGFLIIGFIVGYSKPKELISQIFFCLGISAALGLIFFGGVTNYIGFYNFFWYNYIIGLAFFYPLFFHFFSIFPLKLEFRNRKLFILICYFYALLIHFSPDNLFGLSTYLNETLLIIYSYSPLILILAGFISFQISYRKIKDKKAKKYLRIINYGFLFGLIGLTYYFFVFNIYLSRINLNPFYRIPTILVLAIPLSFGYSILKYRILDTESIIKKSLIFGIVTIFLVITYLLIAFIIDSILLKYFPDNRQFLTIVMILFLTFTFDFVHKKVKYIIEKILFRESYNYRKSLLDFSSELNRINNIEELTVKLELILERTIGLDKVEIVFTDSKYLPLEDKIIEFKKNISREYLENNKIVYSRIHYLNLDAKYLYDIDLINLDLNDFDKEIINRSNIKLSIPLIKSDKIIGVINFSEKISGKAFSDEDLDLLKTLTSHISNTLENIRLKIEELNNRKIEEELIIAKRIQNSLLPKKFNDMLGLSISAYSQPAKIIGGDFYDLIKVSDDKLFIAIADVSGKGIPASLYMAKIQSMLQFACKLFSSPKDILVEINKQIYDRIDKKSFITMILLLIDFNQKKIRIARAGHNPLIYIDYNNDIKILKNKGIGLGLDSNNIFMTNIEESEYNSDEIKLMFLYTDGLVETMNSKKEEFGLKRVIDIIQNKHDSLPDDIIKNIDEEIDKFRNDAVQNDDITFVVVKF